MLKFETDFSDLTLGTDSNGRPSYFLYADGSTLPFRSHINYQTSSARTAIVDDIEAVGGKALELEVFQGQGTRERCDVNIYVSDLEGINDEFYVDAQLKLRSDYDMATPHDNPTWAPWHEIIDLTSEWKAHSECYYIPLHIGKRNADGSFSAALSVRHAHADTGPIDTIWVESKNVILPRGDFFHLCYYVLRHPTNGTIKVWINDTLVFDVSGKPTMLNDVFFTTPAKVYGGEILPEKKLWISHLTIHDSIPKPPKSPLPFWVGLVKHLCISTLAYIENQGNGDVRI